MCGLASRKGRVADPGHQRPRRNCWGRFAALSRHKAAPTGSVQAAENPQICDNRPTFRMPIMKKQAHLHH
ncbi:hypothetical protein C4Q27_04470 [Pseudomonas sp. SWI36]|nr:hypothetical protein C4Q27_04470 [Pseudomonas sp. SWI36]